MGISAWIWFVVAAVALVAGLGLLAADRAKEGSRNRERMRWAQLRGWQFVEEDERLPRQWSGGAIGYFGADAAVNVVAGSTFTSDGRRPVFIFDIESEGQIPATVVAVRCNKTHRVPVEMWLSSVPFQRENMPEMLGPIGQRYAFADDSEGARQVITQELVDAADQLGGDVGVAWLENEWVLASVVPNAGPSRLERLLRDLGEIADIVDPFDEDYDAGQTWTPSTTGTTTTGTTATGTTTTGTTTTTSAPAPTQAPSPADTRATTAIEHPARTQAGQSTRGPQATPGTRATQSTQATSGAEATPGSWATQGSQGAQATPAAEATPGTWAAQGSQGTQATSGAEAPASTWGSQGTQATPAAESTPGSRATLGSQGTPAAEGNPSTRATPNPQSPQATSAAEGNPAPKDAQAAQPAQPPEPRAPSGPSTYGSVPAAPPSRPDEPEPREDS